MITFKQFCEGKYLDNFLKQSEFERKNPKLGPHKQEIVHHKDEDCTVEDGTCTKCGTEHNNNPCAYCGKKAFHDSDCPNLTGIYPTIQ